MPPPPDMVNITRRWPAGVPLSAVTTRVRTIAQHNVPVPRNVRDIAHLQFAWRMYCKDVRSIFSPAFWQFFLPMHTLPRKAVDVALRCAKDTFGPCYRLGTFPQTTRWMFDRMAAKVAPFWPKVMHSMDIDLSAFDLPPNKRSLAFEFIDPLWGWVWAASKQPPREMQWVPEIQTMHKYPNQPLYGGGLQFGEAFAEAYRTCPAGTFPMCVSLHWDGANAHGLQAVPICIGVANTNSMSDSTQYCIGYIPVVSDLGAEFTSTATELKYHIRNQCIAAILRVLETAAQYGVRCRLPSTTQGEEDMILMPRLFSMNLDQPEAQLYFGMLNRMYVIYRIRPYVFLRLSLFR